MKRTALILLSVVSLFSGLSLAAPLNLKCEEGVGNVDQPRQYIEVSGEVDLDLAGILDYNQKNKLKVKIFSNDGVPTLLASNQYTAQVKVGSIDRGLIITTEDGKEIVLSMLEQGLQVLVKVFHGTTIIFGDKKVVGSGVCWGSNPILIPYDN